MPGVPNVLPLEDVTAVYASQTAKARGERVHTGAKPRSKPLPSRDCHTWIDKRFRPYTAWESRGPAPRAQAHETPPLFAPGKPDAKAKAKARSKLMAREPWDTEHHIGHSRMNHEVQVFMREYFDKPVRKENDGVPKVRELYAMNDRQCGWNDDPAELGEMRRTYLDHVGPWNAGGPKSQQLPSWWRNIRNWRTFSEPSLHLGKKKRKEDDDHDAAEPIITALASTPAAVSTQIWHGKLKVPAAEQDIGKAMRSDGAADALTRTSSSFVNSGMGASASREGDKKAARSPWNERWGVTMSKDNPHLTQQHRQYFTSAQFLHGAELGHPGTYLGGKHQQWRNVAECVNPATGGSVARMSTGRHRLLV